MNPVNSANPVTAADPTATTRTTGRFASANWEERQVTSSEASPRLTRASVTDTFSGGIEAAGTDCEYTIVYVTETTGTFNGMHVLSGTVDGRQGTFAIDVRGSFEADGTLRSRFQVVPGSGTGDLAGLSGEGGFTTEHGEESVPYTFDYALAQRP